MKRLIPLFCLALVAAWYARAYAVELTAATDVQLMNEFLLAGATTAQKTQALVGAREFLSLPDTASAAQCAAAMKKWLRKALRENFKAVAGDSIKSGADTTAVTITTQALWAPEAD